MHITMARNKNDLRVSAETFRAKDYSNFQDNDKENNYFVAKR